MRIYTRRGDEGETSLLYGGRVAKSDPRCAAYGTTDEAASALGLARALSADEWVRARVLEVQRELFTVGAELATSPESRDRLQRHFAVVSAAMTRRLETLIDEIASRVQLPETFVVPGASAASAAIDLARTIVRRAEREVVALRQAGLLANPEVARYLNRLSDLLFMLARYEDRARPADTFVDSTRRRRDETPE